jgi:hypothetical protein
VRLSRRDPRESAEAEQYLYDQLVQVIEAPPSHHPTELVLQSAQWYQRFSLAASDFARFCAVLVEQALAEMKSLLGLTAAQGSVGAVLLTAPAAGLPGLVATLQGLLNRPPEQVAASEEDFGEGLLPEELPAPAGVHVLPADAVARGAHELASHCQRGELRSGVLDAVPLPPARRMVPPKLHAGDTTLRGRTRIPFPLGEGLPGVDPSTAAAPLPALRRRTRPHEE